MFLDFDLATNGASYFFAPQIDKQSGCSIFELLVDDNPRQSPINLDKLIIHINEGFDFIPSRRDFGMLKKADSIALLSVENIRIVLNSLIKEVTSIYDYIIIDNQAGYSNSSVAAAKEATKAIIIMEPDSISNDAVENFIGSIGDDLPNFRKYLSNKIEIRELGDYKRTLKTFRLLNRLPPLPFDFDVRRAFGERRIPLHMDNPTPFLIALFRSLKEIIPEEEERLANAENTVVREAFQEHQDKMQKLISRRDDVQRKLVDGEIKLQNTEGKIKVMSSNILSVLGITVAAGVAFGLAALIEDLTPLSEFGLFLDVFLNFSVPVMLVLVSGTLILFVAYLYRRVLITTRLVKMRASTLKEELMLKQQLGELEREIDRYRNLLLTRSRDLLVDYGSV